MCIIHLIIKVLELIFKTGCTKVAKHTHVHLIYIF